MIVLCAFGIHLRRKRFMARWNVRYDRCVTCGDLKKRFS